MNRRQLLAGAASSAIVMPLFGGEPPFEGAIICVGDEVMRLPTIAMSRHWLPYRFEKLSAEGD